MLTWNVYVGDFNRGKIVVHNIFDHYSVMEDLRKAVKKYSKDRKIFAEEVRKSLMYYYWSKCEWEVVIDHWPPRKDKDGIKVDVYDQIRLNWEPFLDYLWNHKEELQS